jgi:chromosome segregation ATPase
MKIQKYNRSVKNIRIILILLTIAIPNIFSKSFELIQKLQTKISSDLLNIRKEFPKSQPTVYSALDQLGKIYKISKDTLSEEIKLKKQVEEKDSENNQLKNENLELKTELNSIKNELDSTKQNFTAVNKKTEQTNAILVYMVKEKQKLIKEKELLKNEKNHLEEERHKLLAKVNQIEKQQPKNNSQKEEILQTKDAFLNTEYPTNLKQRNNYEQEIASDKYENLQEHQSLNLTSTSDPISPR